jgi:plasmid stabilization system protein ParE
MAIGTTVAPRSNAPVSDASGSTSRHEANAATFLEHYREVVVYARALRENQHVVVARILHVRLQPRRHNLPIRHTSKIKTLNP